jgi:hypothetical protein
LAFLPADVSNPIPARAHTPYPGMNIDVAALSAIAVCKSHDAISKEAMLPDGKDDDEIS